MGLGAQDQRQQEYPGAYACTCRASAANRVPLTMPTGCLPADILGLPLSNVKLNLSAFAPLISKADRRLAGWQAALLNHQGRLVLINSVLDGLTTYLMQALVLPPGIIAKLDSRRRAFLWYNTDKTSGA